jgi:hypothetical protein
MIKNIKVYGERNSGTEYLEKLLIKNLKNINLFKNKYTDKTGWKHGFPRLNTFDNIDETLFIFIIRDVKSWLISMFKNPYHINEYKNIYKFISLPLRNIGNSKHDVIKYDNEKGKILNIRYKKIRAYQNFFDKVPHAIIINLSDLQKNYKKFFFFLNEKYNIELNDNLENIIKHTKSKKNNIKNRKYNIELDINKIKINSKIEQFVNSLQGNYKFK